jgi:hypothetical protein
VEIPNGTAAVSVYGMLFDENQPLGNWEGEAFCKGRNHLCKGASQKTYELVLLPFAQYERSVCRGNTAAAQIFCAAVLCF